MNRRSRRSPIRPRADARGLPPGARGVTAPAKRPWDDPISYPPQPRPATAGAAPPRARCSRARPRGCYARAPCSAPSGAAQLRPNAGASGAIALRSAVTVRIVVCCDQVAATCSPPCTSRPPRPRVRLAKPPLPQPETLAGLSSRQHVRTFSAPRASADDVACAPFPSWAPPAAPRGRALQPCRPRVSLWVELPPVSQVSAPQRLRTALRSCLAISSRAQPSR